MSAKLDFMLNSKGSKILIFEGHYFRGDREVNKVKYWRCNEEGCKSRVHTDQDFTCILKEPDYDHLHVSATNRNTE